MSFAKAVEILLRCFEIDWIGLFVDDILDWPVTFIVHCVVSTMLVSYDESFTT